MDTENFTRIMAIDYGTKRIGLALTDPLIDICISLPDNSKRR